MRTVKDFVETDKFASRYLNLDMTSIRDTAKNLRAHFPRKRGVVMRLSAREGVASKACFLGYQTWDGSRRSLENATRELVRGAHGEVRFALHATHPAISAEDAKFATCDVTAFFGTAENVI